MRFNLQCMHFNLQCTHFKRGMQIVLKKILTLADNSADVTQWLALSTFPIRNCDMPTKVKIKELCLRITTAHFLFFVLLFFIKEIFFTAGFVCLLDLFSK